MKSLSVADTGSKTTGRHANDPVKDPINQSAGQESLHKQALKGFVIPSNPTIQSRSQAIDRMGQITLSDNSKFLGLDYQRNTTPSNVVDFRNSFLHENGTQSQIQSLRSPNRYASPFKRDFSPATSFQRIPSNPLKIDITTNEKYSKSSAQKLKTQAFLETNMIQDGKSPNRIMSALDDSSPSQHLSIFQTGRSKVKNDQSNNVAPKIFIEQLGDIFDKEQTFFGKFSGHVKSKPIAPINLSEIKINSPRNILANNTHDVPTITARKGGVRRSHLSQSVTLVPRVSKVSIFEDSATLKPKEGKRTSVQNASRFEYPTSNLFQHQTSISKPFDYKEDLAERFLVLDDQRFIDGPIYQDQSKKSHLNKSEFAPDVFQKLRLLEEEVLKLQAANEQKKLEIKALNGKTDRNSQKSDIANDFLRKDNLRLQEENLRMKARIAELEYLAFGKRPNAHPEIDLTVKVIELEQENREVKQRYENLKKITNNATFEDLEKLMRKIQEMEAYIKSLKRKNELLEAQINS